MEQAERTLKGQLNLHQELELHFASASRCQGGKHIVHPTSFLNLCTPHQEPYLDAQFIPWRFWMSVQPVILQ